ncbi:hypothetical protein B0T24DRAFT_680261 [Lasiosphaeria ovina]|uniref:Uncharacterized protein n=1 Tax=Lasiosphaeria ovina TaxID=92902 RepID=A0AAE0N549_9PEZI|nr:hypothetical protein B0T24DRAFT_680261 [Lasiosphaeria ovina]
MSTTADRVTTIKDLKQPTTLADLEKYIGMATFLGKFIPWFAQNIEPLERRKVQLIKDTKATGKMPQGKSGPVRKKFTSTVQFEPTAKEIESSNIIQEQLCKETNLVHHDGRRLTFIKLDTSKQKGFGATDEANEDASELDDMWAYVEILASSSAYLFEDDSVSASDSDTMDLDRISTTSTDFAPKAYENGVLDPVASDVPEDASATQHDVHQSRRTSTQPSEHAL